MKPPKPIRPVDTQEDLPALIEVLHETVQRLEELTGGQVDSVADRQGRPFLLRRAQEQLRHSEAAKQAAILNALPAYIALLDAQGKIVSVNEAWRKFVSENALQIPGHGVGLNYLSICEKVQGEGMPFAQHAVTGIESVLAGRANSFSFEYPFHSPIEQRWFLMTVAPLADNRLDGAVVMHMNITERKHGELEIQRFSAAMNATADAIYLVDRLSMRFVHVNEAACRMRSRTREELLALGPACVDAISDAELALEYDSIVASGKNARPLEVLRHGKDGSETWVELRRHAQLFSGRWMIVTLERDITERKEAEKRLHHLAHYDTLTNLPNRTLFYETLKRTLAQAADSDWQVAVLCLDLDQFKNVNDTLGHAIGDELLDQVSGRLAQCVRIRDTVGRLGGDEFAVILVMEHGQQGAAIVANKIRNALRAPFDLQGHEFAVTASIGITIHPDDASDPETLMKYADTAMYRAKKAGRDTFRFFTAQMNAEALARLDMETALRKAIDNGEFILHYQPKVQINTGRIVGVEALIRWMRPGHGMVSPGDFIPLLEETGLIVPVGSWVIEAVCRQIASWMRSKIGPIHVAVNVSGRQFVEGDLEAVVVAAIRDNNIEPDLLELELTESSLMSNAEQTVVLLQRLKALGIQISVDDFGTGYSSLAYLKRFQIDKLKIDIAFIRDVITNPDDAAITLAIISMSHSLKLQVIAEGVETEAQLAYLRRHRCDQMQGFYFSRPLPLCELEQMLHADRHLPPSPEGIPLQVQTLLIIDDQATVLTILTQTLRQDGYQVLSALSAAEAFVLLALNPVQVILCDQRMPEMNGTTFLDRVRDLYPNTFRIVLSAHTDLDTILDAVNRGAIHRFYTKPWDSNALRGNIREAFLHH